MENFETKIFASLFTICILIVASTAQSDILDYHFFDINNLRLGNSLPKRVIISTGQNGMMHLKNLPEIVDKCTLTDPDGVTEYDMFAETSINDRISYWYPDGSEKKCGAYINNISKDYEGNWKLRAADSKDKTIRQGFSYIQHIDSPNGAPNNIELTEGMTKYNLALNKTQQVDYCQVEAPMLGSSWSQNCSVQIPEVVRGLEGDWGVNMGLRGFIEETNFKAPAKVYGIEISTKTYALKAAAKAMLCRVTNGTNVTVTFCRFTRTSDSKSFHLTEGLGNDNYRYFGAGLSLSECGLAIENPETQDLGTWECTIGYTNTHTAQEGVVKSYVRINENEKQSKPVRGKSLTETVEIIGGVGHPLTITCKSDIKLKYCWLRSPDDEVFNPNPGDLFDSQNHLLAGQCQLTFAKAQLSHSGLWTCNMGPLEHLQLDIVAHVQVRVSETALAAEEKQVQAQIGDAVTLKCKSVTAEKKQQFCRFTLPDGTSLSLDTYVTANNAIEGLYYYGGTSLVNGECYLQIKELKNDHAGIWNCTASIGSQIGTDTIEVITTEGLTVAAISGIVVAALAVTAVLGIGIKVIKKRKSKQTETSGIINSPTRNSSSTVNSEEIELYNIDLNVPSVSNTQTNH